ncbi:Crp/Fnr family transcriptional regulator [Shivajiella indica]|uniref:Crp/Fnr family transcriptional regulator n=1 Tax=Shivajiella indica TaxID=872115 RepID=A0ABW5BE41_9BACT
MKKLEETLSEFNDIPETSLHAFFAKMKPIQIQKGTFLVKEGNIANYIYFIESGMLRSYYFVNNKEVTISFSFPGDFVTAMSSFIKQRVGYENLETLEDCELYQIHYKDLQQLLNSDKYLEHIYRLVLEQYYIKLEEQFIFSKFRTAKERYLNLLRDNPLIIQKATVGQIASYLDMSLETLSRIRSTI